MAHAHNQFETLPEMAGINKALGSAGGDRVLGAVAERIAAACGPDDRAARIGGDRFAVLFGPLACEADARSAACVLWAEDTTAPDSSLAAAVPSARSLALRLRRAATGPSKVRLALHPPDSAKRGVSRTVPGASSSTADRETVCA